VDRDPGMSPGAVLAEVASVARVAPPAVDLAGVTSQAAELVEHQAAEVARLVPRAVVQGQAAVQEVELVHRQALAAHLDQVPAAAPHLDQVPAAAAPHQDRVLAEVPHQDRVLDRGVGLAPEPAGAAAADQVAVLAGR
jgi:hypothetical protein